MQSCCFAAVQDRTRAIPLSCRLTIFRKPARKEAILTMAG
jgi:hypothetical protein